MNHAHDGRRPSSSSTATTASSTGSTGSQGMFSNMGIGMGIAGMNVGGMNVGMGVGMGGVNMGMMGMNMMGMNQNTSTSGGLFHVGNLSPISATGGGRMQEGASGAGAGAVHMSVISTGSSSIGSSQQQQPQTQQYTTAGLIPTSDALLMGNPSTSTTGTTSTTPDTKKSSGKTTKPTSTTTTTTTTLDNNTRTTTTTVAAGGGVSVIIGESLNEGKRNVGVLIAGENVVRPVVRLTGASGPGRKTPMIGSGTVLDSKRHPCTVPDCGKTFSTSGHLARHLKGHTGVKPYPCPLPDCNSKFSRHDNMLQHYRSHLKRLTAPNPDGSIPEPPPHTPPVIPPKPVPRTNSSSSAGESGEVSRPSRKGKPLRRSSGSSAIPSATMSGSGIQQQPQDSWTSQIDNQSTSGLVTPSTTPTTPLDPATALMFDANQLLIQQQQQHHHHQHQQQQQQQGSQHHVYQPTQYGTTTSPLVYFQQQQQQQHAQQSYQAQSQQQQAHTYQQQQQYFPNTTLAGVSSTTGFQQQHPTTHHQQQHHYHHQQQQYTPPSSAQTQPHQYISVSNQAAGANTVSVTNPGLNMVVPVNVPVMSGGSSSHNQTYYPLFQQHAATATVASHSGAGAQGIHGGNGNSGGRHSDMVIVDTNVGGGNTGGGNGTGTISPHLVGPPPIIVASSMAQGSVDSLAAVGGAGIRDGENGGAGAGGAGSGSGWLDLNPF
ncbi:hypothetical protein HDU76_003172 [Blyttiomyces sp. JEL0837]|nr:hypothetical protein HDU76_003172 [Blyttiomyces sp. JEL0837]